MTRIGLTVLSLAMFGLAIVDTFLVSPWFFPLSFVPTVTILMLVGNADE
jgi:hypothetical protein